MSILEIKRNLMRSKHITRLYRKFKVMVCHISPTLNSKLNYYTTFGRPLNLDNPTEFNEKLQYLKLNDYLYNPLVWKCSDKYRVREYAIESGVSECNLTKVLGIYDDANDINFNSLPEKFVLKCSHGCGFNFIVEDKSRINEKECITTLNEWKKRKYGYEGSELQYTKIPPVIFCEEFIENEEGEFPYDYKFYCYYGLPKVVLVCFNRKNKPKHLYYDLEWNKLNFMEKDTIKSEGEIEKPDTLDSMIELSKTLSAPFPFVRIDLYQYDGRVILGEMSFTPAADCDQDYSVEGSNYLASFLDVKKNEKSKRFR